MIFFWMNWWFFLLTQGFISTCPAQLRGLLENLLYYANNSLCLLVTLSLRGSSVFLFHTCPGLSIVHVSSLCNPACGLRTRQVVLYFRSPHWTPRSWVMGLFLTPFGEVDLLSRWQPRMQTWPLLPPRQKLWTQPFLLPDEFHISSVFCCARGSRNIFSAEFLKCLFFPLHELNFFIKIWFRKNSSAHTSLTSFWSVHRHKSLWSRWDRFHPSAMDGRTDLRESHFLRVTPNWVVVWVWIQVRLQSLVVPLPRLKAVLLIQCLSFVLLKCIKYFLLGPFRPRLIVLHSVPESGFPGLGLGPGNS